MSGQAASQTPAGPVRAIAEELVRGGVRDVVVCPGSRSTPLALALRLQPGLRTWVHIDERAAGFFGLGLAKGSRRAVVLVSTSGTAAVNFGPAVVEAHHGRVPLVVMTADRPPELRDRGANQAIDQAHLYGRHAKWYVELPVPEASPSLEAHARGIVGRAIGTATSAPAGPVQVNLPFREPLVPDGSLRSPDDGRRAPWLEMIAAERMPAVAALDELAARIGEARRGLIVCGPMDAPGFADAVGALAAATGFPILADGLSNVRVGRHDRSHVIARYDAIVRVPAFRERHAPDLVLRFGAAPTSRALLEMLAAPAAPQVVVDDGGWTEPTLQRATIVHAEPVALAGRLAERLSGGRADPGWLRSWREADDVAGEALEGRLAAQPDRYVGAAVAAIAGILPDGAVLLAGNSMPVRDLDSFLPSGAAAIRCLGNRGASGIDGLVSTALGLAAGQAGPVVAIVGDLSLIHDLNALIAARRLGLSVTVVLIDNDGGGVFELLAQASTDRDEVGLPAHFEELFGTPHGLDLGPVVTALGAEHRSVGLDELGAGVAASLAAPTVQVLHLRTDRKRDAELRREALAMVVQALEGHLASGTGTPGTGRA